MESILIILTVIATLIWIIILLSWLKVIEFFNNSGAIAKIDFTTNKISAVNISGKYYIKVFSLVNPKLRRIINTHNFGTGDIISISLVYVPELKIGIVYNIKHITNEVQGLTA